MQNRRIQRPEMTPIQKMMDPAKQTIPVLLITSSNLVAGDGTSIRKPILIFSNAIRVRLSRGNRPGSTIYALL